MKDLSLERGILRILWRVDAGIRETTLKYETEIAVDRVLLRDDFEEAMRCLNERGLIKVRQNLIGERVWSITRHGVVALKGE